MNDCCEQVIPPNHPSLAGHFPGRPLVPGVVLLETVLAGLEAGRRLVAVNHVKFLAPLAPGQVFTIHYSDNGGNTGERVSFRCERAGQVLAQGQLTVAGRLSEPPLYAD